MHILTYAVCTEPAEEVGNDVFVPTLPGYVMQADTYEEAVVMDQEAIEGLVKALALAGEPVCTGTR